MHQVKQSRKEIAQGKSTKWNLRDYMLSLSSSDSNDYET